MMILYSLFTYSQYLPEIGLNQLNCVYPFHPHFFSLHQLTPSMAQAISIGCSDDISKIHGWYTHQLLKKIAPCATLIFIKSAPDITLFAQSINTLGYSRPTILLVNRACKEPLDHTQVCTIEDYLSKYQWVIAAAGNYQQSYYSNGCAYPARSCHVTYSVGSYGKNRKISAFSQSSITNMPTLLAPGECLSIDGCTISGTSISSALIAGFMALVLGEFGHFFSKEQLMIIINYALFKEDKAWQSAVRGGYIDFRMAIYMMHMLKRIYINSEIPSLNKISHHAMRLRTFLLNEIDQWFSDFCAVYPCQSLIKPTSSLIALNDLIESDVAHFMKFLKNL